MTTESPRLKSHTLTTDQPHPAEPADTPADRGAPKVAARQGVPSSLRPDPHPTTSRPTERLFVASWIWVTAPARRSGTPTAESWCRCGWHRIATGRTNVMCLQTTHAHHRDTACPLTHPIAEGRPAA
jgi:hypothetical protein